MIKELTKENISLPIGWELTALGKVCEVIAGQSPESKFYNTNEEGLAFYQGKKDFSDKYIGQPTKWTTKITKEAIKNDILMSVRAPVGPVNFSIQRCCIGRGLAAIRTSEKIDKEYLYNFLVKFKNEIEVNEGAVFNSINKSQIGAIPIPLPPLPQQKQIVATLDKAFTAIDTAKANAEQNLQNAKELFESYLQNVFKNKLDDWEEKTLGDFCHFENGRAFKKTEWTDEGLPIIRIANLNRKKASFNYYNGDFNNKILISKGDLLFSWSGTIGSSFGPHIWNSNDGLLNQHIYKVGFPKTIDLKFLYYLFLVITSELEKLTNGAVGLVHVKKSTLNNYTVYIPPFQQQKQIAEKLDALFKKTKKLETIYSQKIADLEEMKKSILQKAFSGELNTLN